MGTFTLGQFATWLSESFQLAFSVSVPPDLPPEKDGTSDAWGRVVFGSMCSPTGLKRWFGCPKGCDEKNHDARTTIVKHPRILWAQTASLSLRSSGRQAGMLSWFGSGRLCWFAVVCWHVLTYATWMFSDPRFVMA